ncbi:hotdog fold thioesterase [Salinicola sp. JS01]|uniref:hotdog fold thioesterase n=1 Tax=Salinicola sp. JS01 TaxID=3050071 RepID=UPI00255BEBCC|nr:hotdog fold thioesterase [Salinicola sp. JS01]WIX32761.1 hotdog fold thioesterase [Salinicola sp. JS01]
MSIWKRSASLEALATQCQQTLVTHIGIEFTELGDDCLRGRMPVDARTHQPYGLLHGGASVVLAETLGSIAANLCLADESKMAVGMEINANHVRAVREGWVEGCARPLHLGSTTQLWEIRIEDERGRLVCVSRLTMAVVKAA